MLLTAIYVTYNPDIARFSQFLDVTQAACDRVIIVDNSTDIYLQDRVRKLQKANIQVISLGANYGIATAQNRGIAAYKENKCRYVIFLDQDSDISKSFSLNLIENFEYYSSKFRLAAVGPGPLSKPVHAVKHIKSSGMLTNKDVIDDLGGYIEDLFIDLVDYEWCWRAKSKGYQILACPGDFNHTLGEPTSILGFFTKSIASPMRHYYQTRNLFLLWKLGYSDKKWLLVRILLLPVKMTLYVLLFRPRVLRIKSFYMGLRAVFNTIPMTGKNE